MWSNFCDHVKKVEYEYWEKDGLIEDALEEFVIRLSESDFDSSTDDNDMDTDSDTPSDDEHDVALQREEKILREALAQEEHILKISYQNNTTRYTYFVDVQCRALRQ